MSKRNPSGESSSAVSGRKRLMLLSLFQAVACAASLSGCGGGGGGDSPTETAQGTPPPVSSPAPAPASSPVSSPAPAPVAQTPPASVSGVGLDFTFTLSASRTTSAGVYTPDGTLVRTLWRGEKLAAGTYTRSWDQLDDGGNKLAAGSYTVKVVHHDVQYVWEGAVGNTSVRAGSAVLHHSYRGPTSFAAVSGGMLYAVGYNEAQSGVNGFTLANPQLNQSPVRLVDPFVSVGMIASDAKRLYWANTGQGIATKTFVGAYDLATGAQATFTNGTAVCLNLMTDGQTCYAAQTYASLVDIRDAVNAPPTGIAVQANGSLLAVAYGTDNAIHLLDKASGSQVGSISVPLATNAINQIAMSPAGDLWVLSGATAVRYTHLATTPTVAATVTGLSSPLAITVDPHDENGVWIADGGTSEQLKRFNAQGVAQQAIGAAGGYGGQSLVASDRLNFMQNASHEQTTLAVDDTHAIWVMDTCNNRMLKFSAAGVLADQVAYIPASYAMSADAGNPTRVFSNFLEFSVDYSKGIDDPGAWTLVRNWLPALPANLRMPATSDWTYVTANWGWTGFRTVVTMSNGRTYALLGVGAQSVIVELTATGSVRFVRTLRTAGVGETAIVLYENGDLGYSGSDGATQSVLRLPLQGFDASGNPSWPDSPTTIASAPVSAAAATIPPLTFTGVVGARFPISSTGKVIFFNAGIDADSGFHLGAVAQGAGAWSWQASPSGPLDGLGTFQTKKDDPGLNYGGNLVHALGRDIVYGYHGEDYTDLGNGKFGEANQFMHFRDDGLFIGEFGVASTRATSASQPGLSGNAFSSTFLRVGTETYLYHNDESTFGGVQRWHLTGLDDIQELAATGVAGTAIQLQ